MALGRGWVVALLFGISLFTYIDRWSAAAILNDLQAPPDPPDFRAKGGSGGGSGGGFGLTDTDGGLVTSVFVIAYMLLSPVFGYLGDRMPRIPLLFMGILVWSVSTFLSSFSYRFWQFLFFRSLVGVGEASYAVLAPTLIADLYPAGPERTRVLGYYCTSIPLGSALGYVYAGEVARLLSWRYAFRFSPVISFLLSAVLLLCVSEPDRGSVDIPVGLASAAAYPVPGTSAGLQAGVDDSPPIGAKSVLTATSGGDRVAGLCGASVACPAPAANGRGAGLTRATADEQVAAIAGISPSPLGTLSAGPPTASPTVITAAAINGNPSRGIASFANDVASVLRTRSFFFCNLGAIGMTFTAGALAQWAPSYLQRVNCTPTDAACEARITRTFGIVTIITGTLGTLSGAGLSRWYAKRSQSADAIVCGMGLLLATPSVFISIYLAPTMYMATWAAIFAGEWLVSLVWAPYTAILLSVVPPNQRGTANSLSLLTMHLFGDSMSPILVGVAADALHSGGNGVSRAVALQHALYLSVVSTVIGSLFFLYGGRFLPADRAAAMTSSGYRPVSPADPGIELQNLPRRHTSSQASAELGAFVIEDDSDGEVIHTKILASVKTGSGLSSMASR
jgi:MFS family permease